jgi:ribokinase
LKPGDVDLAAFQKARVLHVDGLMIEASIEAARQARKMGWAVVMDGGTLREGTSELVSLVDILIASEGFAGQLAGKNAPPEEALEAMLGMGPGTAVITMGAEGSIGAERGRVHFQNPFSVESVDTTGAGDVYHGGYIYGLLQGWDMTESMRFASAVAAMKCRHIGARKGIPRLDEVMRFMQDQGSALRL